MTTNNNHSNHCTHVTNSHNNTPTTNPSLLSLNVDESDNNDNDSDSHVDRTQLTATITTSNEHSQLPVTYLIERNNTVIEDMSLIGLLSRANSATSTSSSSSSSSHLQSPLPVVAESHTRLPPNTALTTPPLPFPMVHSSFINSITNVDNNRDVPSSIESNIVSYVDNMRNPGITRTTITPAPISNSDYIRYQHNRSVQHPSLYSSMHSHLDRRYIPSSSFSSCFDDSTVTGTLSDENHSRQNRDASSVPMSEQHRMDLLRDILDAAIMIGDQTASTLSSLHQITSRRPSSTTTTSTSTSTSTTVTESSIVRDVEMNDNHNNADDVAVLCNDDNDPPQLSSPLAATTTTISNTSTPIINRNNNNNDDSTYRTTNRNLSTSSSKHHKNNNHSTFLPPRQ